MKNYPLDWDANARFLTTKQQALYKKLTTEALATAHKTVAAAIILHRVQNAAVRDAENFAKRLYKVAQEEAFVKAFNSPEE